MQNTRHPIPMPVARRHNPVAIRQKLTVYVEWNGRNYVEMEDVEIHDLHPTKGWRKRRGSRIIRSRRTLRPEDGRRFAAQGPITGYRYKALPNPKYQKKEAA